MQKLRDIRLFLYAWVILFSARLIWNVVSLRHIWKIGASSSTPGIPPPDGDREIRNIALAIARAGARIPGLAGPTCLTRALAAILLLRRTGLPCRLFIGVRKNAEGSFGAHAWVASGEKIVVGDLPDLATYTPLPIGAAIPPLR